MLCSSRSEQQSVSSFRLIEINKAFTAHSLHTAREKTPRNI